MNQEQPRIVFSLMVDFDEGQRLMELNLPMEQAWSLEEMILMLGYQRAAALAGLGARIQLETMKARLVEIDDPEDKKMMGQAVSKALPSAMQGQIILLFMEMMEEELYGRTWATITDRVFDFTRHRLQSREITWEQAADIASRVLNKNYSGDAYRKKLERWTKQQGLPPVAIYTRKEPEH